jgi:type IV pilus assembly protein PilA
VVLEQDMDTGRDDEHGFTLIELLMVVTIIAILLAIAIPIFLGARERSNDRAAQTLVRNLLVSAKTADLNGTPSAASIQADEPSLHVVSASTVGQANESEVSVWVGTVAGEQYMILASRSASGSCFAALEPKYASTRYQSRAAGACTADSFDPTSGWSDQWN